MLPAAAAADFVVFEQSDAAAVASGAEMLSLTAHFVRDERFSQP